ncbi:hypothetical protein [Natronosalvus hydrolyticus]|uniref:hypothetical protein n=1 Tax=Natronosalvus hydrolyticus TaxID=2979988 RepID=UPI00319D8D9E
MGESGLGFLARFVDGLPEVFGDDILHLVVVHKLLKEFLVLVSAIDEQLGKHAVELEGEIVSELIFADCRRRSFSSTSSIT